jgi:hypothetical protein
MEPQTRIDVQRILDRKRKRAEYDKQRKLKRKIDFLAYKIQTPGNYPEESIQHSEHDKSLKSRSFKFVFD